MATTRYNRQTFMAEVNGNQYCFYAWTTSTRNGFCHTISAWGVSDTKISYWNRTWERFTYETVLNQAIKKMPKADQQGLREILIERKAQKDAEECDAFLRKFEAMHKALTPENKERLASTVGHIENEAQANAALAVGQLMVLMQ